MIILLFIMLILGLSYICLGMKKHHLQAIPNTIVQTNNTLAIIIGYLILTISCLVSIYHWGVGIGLIFYMVIFTLAHLASILLITYKPKQLHFFSGFYCLFDRPKTRK